MRCNRCNQEHPPDASFCAACGSSTTQPDAEIDSATTLTTEPPAHSPVAMAAGTRRSVAPAIAAAVVLLALVVGGAAFVIGSNPTDEQADVTLRSASTLDSTNAPPATDSSTVPATTVPAAVTTVPTTIATTTTLPNTVVTSPPLDPVSAAAASLVATIDADRAAVDARLGTWVPQISAKRDGLVWESVAYDLPGIDALHQQLNAEYGALLVNGAEYNFRIDDAPMAGWFVTIADQSFPTPAGALDWCRDNAIDRQNCAAKLITNDQDASSTLVLQ